MRKDHPVESFRFILRNNPSPELSEEIADLVRELATNRRWVISQPKVRNNEDGLLTIEHDVYSAQEPWNKYIPIDIDRRHFEEVRDLVASLCKLKLADYEVHLGNIYVGRIFNGQSDRTLKEGLLEPWDQTTRGSID